MCVLCSHSHYHTQRLIRPVGVATGMNTPNSVGMSHDGEGIETSLNRGIAGEIAA